MHKIRREIEKDKQQRFDKKKIQKLTPLNVKSKIEIILEVFFN